MWHSVGSGLFLGWTLGANDSANIFGTAVASRMVPYRKAVILICIFLTLGAVCQGSAGLETLHQLAPGDFQQLSLATLGAALTVTVMTALSLPVSTSQAVGGAIFLTGLLSGTVDYHIFLKMIICWVLTPFGGAICAMLLYKICGAILTRLKPSIYFEDVLLRYLLISCGCYGAYSLGANNAANVATALYQPGSQMAPQLALFIGALAISAGTLTFSYRVMMTVGKGLIKMDAFGAFIAVLSHSITLHIFSYVGVPVSSSQAIVGGIIGICLIKGAHIMKWRMLGKVLSGWIMTPLTAATITYLLLQIF